jgi:hypothetical protein
VRAPVFLSSQCSVRRSPSTSTLSQQMPWMRYAHARRPHSNSDSSVPGLRWITVIRPEVRSKPAIPRVPTRYLPAGRHDRLGLRVPLEYLIEREESNLAIGRDFRVMEPEFLGFRAVDKLRLRGSGRGSQQHSRRYHDYLDHREGIAKPSRVSPVLADIVVAHLTYRSVAVWRGRAGRIRIAATRSRKQRQ